MLLAAGVALGLALGGATVAVATSSSHSTTVKVCVTGKGVVRAASAHNKCPKHTHEVTLNRRGPTGASGPRGATGGQGPGAKISSGTAHTPTTTPITTMPGNQVIVGCYGQNVQLQVQGTNEYDVAGTMNVDSGAAYGIGSGRITGNYLMGTVEHSLGADLLIIDEVTGEGAQVIVQEFDPTLTGDNTCHYHVMVIPSSS